MSYQYDQYLVKHKENVKKGFEWFRANFPELADGVAGLEWQVCFAHDQSKSELDEYEAYDAYFYGNNKSYAVVQEYRKAWLLHIHRNPHHWQHWILINDDPNEGEIILEMPYNYVVEMICDWWAFSWAKGDLTEIFKWYDEHKAYMRLHPNTRKKVEEILGKIAEKLDAMTSDFELAHHGIKGQKWGVRNGPPYPLDGKQVEKTDKSSIVKTTISGHSGISPRGIPNSIVDHVDHNGKVDKRAFYDEVGWKVREIHTTNHGNPKEHPYGEHGEHIHYYEWGDTGKMNKKGVKEMTAEQRKENEDIL